MTKLIPISPLSAESYFMSSFDCYFSPSISTTILQNIVYAYLTIERLGLIRCHLPICTEATTFFLSNRDTYYVEKLFLWLWWRLCSYSHREQSRQLDSLTCFETLRERWAKTWVEQLIGTPSSPIHLNIYKYFSRGHDALCICTPADFLCSSPFARVLPMACC